MGHTFDMSILPWEALEVLSSKLSSCEPSDAIEHQNLLAHTQWSYFQELRKEHRLLTSRDVTKHHLGIDDLGPWSALAATYSEVRNFLPLDERERYDSIYLPFIGPWVVGLEDEPRVFDLGESKSILQKVGIGWAFNPERCISMANLFNYCSFSRLIHVAFSSGNAASTTPWSRVLFS